MDSTTQMRIVKLRNEIRAQKQASELAWGQLAFPEDTPVATFNGPIDLSAPIRAGTEILTCRFVARFTRTDGQTGAPLVQFAFDFNVSPTTIEIERQRGATVTTTSDEQLYWRGISAHVLNSGDDWVEYEISFDDATGYWLMTSRAYDILGVQNVNLELNVYAISPVVGTLTLERRYDVE